MPRDTATINAGEFLILSAGNILTSEVLPQHDVFYQCYHLLYQCYINRFLFKICRAYPRKNKQEKLAALFKL